MVRMQLPTLETIFIVSHGTENTTRHRPSFASQDRAHIVLVVELP